MTRLYSVVTFLLVLSVAPGVAAAPMQDVPPAVEQPAVYDDPPAHVSLVDGVAVLERDGEIDDSPANMPLLAGDRVRTRDGRVEILFAGGATLHLDSNTTVDFQSDELVRLLEGRIRLSIPGAIDAVSYRVDTPSGWAQITQPGEYRLALLRGDRGEELELAVLRGGAELLTDAGRTSLRAGERAYARASAVPSSAYVFNSARWDAFDRWSEAQREHRLGLSAQYLPDEVRPYAASFDRYGSWRHDPTHGYVWYPTVSADWRPYHYGRWVALPSYGWTWVGRDRWDWPTHHYGRWGLSGGVWFWIPGRRWATAWVSWAYAPNYVSWCPLGWNNRPIIQINVFHGRSRWHPWTVVPRHHFGRGFVHARAVSFRGFDDRTRRLFTYRNTAPEYRGVAVPRAARPIRTAGARLGRAVPRGSSPVYTNLGPRESRVDAGSRRVMVPPSGSRSAVGRNDAAAQPSAGLRAVPRADVASGRAAQRPQVDAPGARQRAGASASGASSAPSSARPPDDEGRRGVRAAPRMPSPSGQRPSRGIARERSLPAPSARSDRPSATSAPPTYRAPVRRAPEGSRPSGIRAVPRGGAPSARDSRPSQVRPPRRAAPSQARPSSGGGGSAPQARPSRSSAPAQARPSRRAAPSQARPSSGGGSAPQARPSRSSAPAQARPSRPSGGNQPSARPQQRSGGDQGAPKARPRGGREGSGGSAVPRRRGGV